VRQGLVMVCDVDLGIADAGRTHTLEVARCFAYEGLDVDLVARGPDPEVAEIRYTQGSGLDTDRVLRFFTLNLHVFRLLWQRRRSARRLYVRHRWTLMPTELVGWLLGYRLVTQIDDVPYGPSYEQKLSPVVDYAKRFFAWLMGRMAVGIVAVTPEIKGLLVDQFRVPARKVAVLPNGVDVDFFQPRSREQAIDKLGLDPQHIYVLFCGNLAPWVDFDTILGGFAQALAVRPHLRLLIVGEGLERKRIEAQISQLGISDAVEMTGFVSDREKIRDLIAASSVTLSANTLSYRARIGVSPVKLGEYMASGRAVAATDLPGLRQLLEETGAGIVVPVDAAAMAEAIVGLSEPGRADELGRRGRRVAEERLSWRLVVRRTVALFGL
jgi:glycosyltransferase involved in cell wall biosynthesis